jgi:rhodanese-related sulfurtransferase
MNSSTVGKSGETGAGLARGVILIVLAGAVVGLGYNVMQQRANPSKSLTWIREETTLGNLESYQGANPEGAQASGGQPGPAPATPASGSGAGDVASAATGDPPGASNPAGTSRAAHQPAGAPATTHPDRTPAPSVTPPAHQAPTTPTPAPQTTAPAGGAQTSTPASTNPAPAVADLPVIPDVSEPLEMQLTNVKKFIDAGAAAIVDARSTEEFAEGHIPGAVNLPFDDVYRDEARLKAFDSGGRPIIVYCGGGDCELSKSLALSLVQVGGQKKVLVFTGGITDWQKAGYPLVKGAAGGSH